MNKNEIFISKAKKIHGNKYDYSLINYKDQLTKIKIICPIHGEFEQAPKYHLQGKNCKKCSIIERVKKRSLTTEEFINRAIKVHNNKYNYDLVEYINSSIKVKIICLKHGEFKQSPFHHLNGHGCPKCSIENKSSNNPISTEEFIKKAIDIHGNKYSYDLVNYKGSFNKIKIICEEHGIFKQKPCEHLNNKGCPICGGTKKLTTEEFINRAKKIHGNKYSYDLVNYINNSTKVKILCLKHGEFEQTPNGHLSRKSGCPICNSSKGELQISKLLKERNIFFEPQYSFKDCKNINLLSFDFYLPKLNICIEYDGIQHFEPIWGEENLKEQISRDEIKDKYCLHNNIKLIRIKYDENIEEKLNCLKD